MAVVPILLAALGAAEDRLKFAPWEPDPRYVKVSFEKRQLTCTDTGALVKQLDADSVMVEGATFGKPTPLADYGLGTTTDRLLYESGMFLPELDPCTVKDPPNRQRSGAACAGHINAWLAWQNHTAVDNYGVRPCPAKGCTLEAIKQRITHLKYNPTGVLNLREKGSAKANHDIYDRLSRLSPPPRTAGSEPYSPYNNITRAMWGIYHNPDATQDDDPDGEADQFPFVGMVQMKHPVYDAYDEYNKALFEPQHRVVVKRCPGEDTTECCLSMEGGTNEALRLTSRKLPLSARLNHSRTTEKRLRWHYRAVHTSFARGVPDLHSYQSGTLQNDIETANGMRYGESSGTDTLASRKQKCNTYFAGLQTQTGSNERKCYTNPKQNKAGGQIGAYLEHFYVALAGVDEQKAHSQPHTFEEYDRDAIRRTFCNYRAINVDIGNYKEYMNNTEIHECIEKHYKAVCSKMPGGHCGHGYSCNDDEFGDDLAHDGVSCFPMGNMFWKGNNSEKNGDYKYNYMRFAANLDKLQGAYVDEDGDTVKADRETDGVISLQKLQFRNRVRGRPELVQWWGDRIYYSGNRGRPDRWVCEWPPYYDRYICRFDGRLLTATEANQPGTGCWTETLSSKKWGQFSQGNVKKMKDFENGWCIDGKNALYDDSLKKYKKKGAWVEEFYHHQCTTGSGDPQGRLLCKPSGWRCDWPFNDPPGTQGQLAFCSVYGGRGDIATACSNGNPDTFQGQGLYKGMANSNTAAARGKPFTYEANGCMDIRDHGCYWDCSQPQGPTQPCGWNCTDLEYESATRSQYMSYGGHYQLHALDALSSGLKGLDAPVRMSGREIFTYGLGSNNGLSEDTECNGAGCDSNAERYMDATFFETMLPCRGGKGVERSCYSTKATKYEWLVAAMYQSIARPTSDLLYGVYGASSNQAKMFHPANLAYVKEKCDNCDSQYAKGKNYRPFFGSTDSGQNGGAFPHHNVHGPKHLLREDRVFLWDIDQAFAFHNGDDETAPEPWFGYNGADPDSHQMNNFKSILYNDRLDLSGDGNLLNAIRFTVAVPSTVPGTNPTVYNWDTANAAVKDLTRWGASDGTSRTNMHAVSCWVDNPLQENWFSAGCQDCTTGFQGLSHSKPIEERMGGIDRPWGLARRACLGVNMARTASGGYYFSYSARPSAWPYNFGFMRATETIPMTTNSNHKLSTDFYRTHNGQDGFGDWGVMGLPLGSGQMVGSGGGKIYAKMALPCNYNDLFATRTEYIRNQGPEFDGFQLNRREFLGFNRASRDSPNLMGQTQSNKDNDYAQNKYFYGLQGSGWKLAKDEGGDDWAFSGSYSRCCANTPVTPTANSGRRAFGYDKCARQSPNNWDYPYNMHRKKTDSAPAQASIYAQQDSKEDRHKLKQGSIHFHTCSDLRNATHFKIFGAKNGDPPEQWDMYDLEEWDMFIEVEHQTHTQPTNIDVDSHSSAHKWDNGQPNLQCPISNTASHSLFPDCPLIQAQIKVTTDQSRDISGCDPNCDFIERQFGAHTVKAKIVKMSEAFDTTLDADKYDTQTSANALGGDWINGDCGGKAAWDGTIGTLTGGRGYYRPAKEGPKIGRVNWGKFTAPSASSTEPVNAVYSSGKTDGVLECVLDEAHDLLLYSFLKSMAVCTETTIDLETGRSNCRNPKHFAKWRTQGTGLALNPDHFPVAGLSNGREMPKEIERCNCKTLLEVIAVEKCACGALARTSRIVLTPDHNESEFHDDYPYAPEWVVGPAEDICALGNIGSPAKRRGFNPRRVCPRSVLENTDLWTSSDFTAPFEPPQKYFTHEDLSVPMVEKKQWSQYELDRMASCANDDEYCGKLTLDLGVTAGSNSARRYILYRQPMVGDTLTGSCTFDTQNVDGIVVVVEYLDDNDELGATGGVPVCVVKEFTKGVPERLEEFALITENGYVTISADKADAMSNLDAFVLEMTVVGYTHVLDDITQTISVDMAPFEAHFGTAPTNVTLQGNCLEGENHFDLELTELGLWTLSDYLPVSCGELFNFVLLASTDDGEEYRTDWQNLWAKKSCRNPDRITINNYLGPKLPSGVNVAQIGCISDGLQIEDGAETYCYNPVRFSEQLGGIRPYMVDPQYSWVTSTYHSHQIPTNVEHPGTNFYLRWGECGWLVRVTWENSTDATLFYRGQTVPTNLIDTPTETSPQTFEYRSATDPEVRELCFQSATSPFSRTVTTAVPGKRMKLVGGDCQRCINGEPQAIINAVVHTLGEPDDSAHLGGFGTDSPHLCNWACVNTTNCTSFSYHRRMCTLYKTPPAYGKSTNGMSLGTTRNQALSYGVDLIVFCIEGAEGQVALEDTTPTPVEPIKCPGGLAGTFPECFLTSCGEGTRVVRLNQRELGCTDRHHPDCRRLCNPTGLLPQRTLFAQTPPRVEGHGSRYNEATDGFFRTKIPLRDVPYFYFELPQINGSSLAQMRVRLPSIGPPCIDITRPREGYNLSTTNLVVTLLYNNQSISPSVQLQVQGQGNIRKFEEVTFEFVTVNEAGSNGGRYEVEVRLEDEYSDGNHTLYLPGSSTEICEPVQTLEAIFNFTEENNFTLADLVAAGSRVPGGSAYFQVELLKYCDANTDDFHICVPHKSCGQNEYQVRAGTLHSDTVCARQPTCRFDERESAKPTSTTARVCTPHTVCTGPHETNTTGTLEKDATCMLRAPCGPDEYSVPSLYAAQGGCTKVQVCSEAEPQLREAKPAAMFADAVCEAYTVECTATQYEADAQTTTAERKCADETICRTDQYVANPSDPIPDRQCSPVLKCESYEVETASGGLASKTECTSMLQWSAAWVYTIVGAPLFGYLAFRSWPI